MIRGFNLAIFKISIKRKIINPAIKPDKNIIKIEKYVLNFSKLNLEIIRKKIIYIKFIVIKIKASNPAFLTKASIFKEIGGFDETLFAHMEEIDYHWKCQLNGYKIYINPTSVIYHKGGQTLKYGSYKKIFLNHRNSLILLLTNYKKFSLTRYTKRLSLEIIAFIYYLLFLKFSAASAVLMANMWVCINIAYLIKRKKDNDRYHNNEPLISHYSIIKKYYLNNKKKYSQLNN